MKRILLSRRALRDLREIEDYSRRRWGASVARGYIREIELALDRLRENPGILHPKREASLRFKFYRAESHFLVCDRVREDIAVLTIVHAGMDLPNRIEELEPNLTLEAEALYKRLIKRT